MAAQVFSAMTATPPSGWNTVGGGGASISTITLSTPGTFIVLAASKLLTLPPKTGGRATTA